VTPLPDFHSPEFQDDLYANYARLREAGPVHRTLFRDSPRYSLFRHDDVVAGLCDERLGSSNLRPETRERLLQSGCEPLANLARLTRGFLVLLDPPDHTRLRGLAQRAFSSGNLAALRPRIEGLAHDLLGGLARAGRADLVRDFAVPLPVIVIAELLGVPSDDRMRLKRWSDDIAPLFDRTLQHAALGAAMGAAQEFAGFFRGLVEQRRAEPREDLISALVAARDADDALDDDEIVALSLFLLVAGHETTTNLIGNSVLALLDHPEQWALLCEEPGLCAGALEELLRFDSPVQRTVRLTREPVEVAGVRIPAGEIVDLVVGSANRDPSRFPEPDRLDLERADTRHLSFGLGRHFCLGARLARLEGQVALRTLVERFPTLKCVDERPRWKPGTLLRGLESLCVVV
jgi:cytochrome P450